MSETARRYAQALYEVSPDSDEALQRTASYLSGTPALWEALCSPAIEAAEKYRVLARVLPAEDHGPLLRFYEVLAKNGRIPLLPEIVDAFQDIALAARGSVRCRLVCAHVPEPEQLERLRTALCRLHHKSDVIFDVETDSSLLGGFRLELEGYTYDKSVRGVLRGLKQLLEGVRTA